MIIPTLIVRDIPACVIFYTQILDFNLVDVHGDAPPFYAVLTRGSDEMHLSRLPAGKAHGRSSAIVVCAQIDALFATFVARGLAVPPRPASPVHEGPIDQTWGTREVYIDDPDGNTLCFQQR